MNLPIFTHFASLIISSISIFFWTSQPRLNKYSLELTGFLILIFIFHNWFNRWKNRNSSFIRYQTITNSIIANTLILLLVLSTNSLTSPLFFLLDFLLFILSLFYYPVLGFLQSLALTLLFLLSNDLNSTHQLTNLVSLLLMAPIAQLFGTQYQRLLEDQNEIKILKHQSKQLKSEIEQQETDSLIWLSINFKNKIHQAIDITSQLITSLTTIPYYQKDKLQKLYQDLITLLKSGGQLEKKIDELTDEK